MVSETREKEILKMLAMAVVEYDDDRVKEWSLITLEENLDPFKAIVEGLSAGMEKVGKLYDQQEYFVPELLMCADTLYIGLDILKPHIKTGTVKITGQVVLGTVQGDVHDIGKNILKLMFEVGGFEVHDLGRDVPFEKFVEEQLRTGSDIVAISAMMTTTMMGMKKLIPMLREKAPDVAIMIGGAPVTQEVATLFGADGYANSASTAVQEALKMIDRLKKHQQSG